MSKNNDFIKAWQDQFHGIGDHYADQLLEAAKTNATTYREASTYIKRVEQQAFGNITDPVERAARQINEAVSVLALHKLHEEERDLPIDKGAEQ